MLGAEAVKIMRARFLETDQDFETYVLTFNSHGFDYTLLNLDLKKRWLEDQQDDSPLKISHWSYFISKILKDHKDLLTPNEKEELEKEIQIPLGDDLASELSNNYLIIGDPRMARTGSSKKQGNCYKVRTGLSHAHRPL